jgi:hypothetical protein
MPDLIHSHVSRVCRFQQSPAVPVAAFCICIHAASELSLFVVLKELFLEFPEQCGFAEHNVATPLNDFCPLQRFKHLCLALNGFPRGTQYGTLLCSNW